MKRLGSGLWFGLALIALGMIMAIELAQEEIDLARRVDLAVLRSLAALAAIALGSRLVAAAWQRYSERDEHHELWFGGRRTAPAARARAASYDVVLGRGVIDLRDLAPPTRDVTIHVASVLGSCVVEIDPAVPYDVTADSVFGRVRAPAHPPVPGPTAPRLHLVLAAICGTCEVVEAAATAARPAAAPAPLEAP